MAATRIFQSSIRPNNPYDPNVNATLALYGRDSSADEGDLMASSRLSVTQGAVCDEGFGMAEANVACRQRGFRRARAFTTGSFFQQGGYSYSRHVSEMAGVRCRGNELLLQDCTYYVRRHSCRGRTAGVICTST